MIEISFTKQKMYVIAARNSKHYTLEFYKIQGKKLLLELNNDYNALAERVRLSKFKQLYILDLNKILYPNNIPHIGSEQMQ
mmetsp:Transcript_29714/g.28894  ORF Transcript_29714/g.28894 Transcript_29714/m.28894 type:complete len:81 (-) Transcript_29714:433-675(-)